MEQTIPRTGRVPKDSFALRLVMLRHELGLSQEQAATICGLKASTWATWENGVKPRGMDEVVGLIASQLDCDRGWLMFGGHPQGFDGPDTPPGLESTPRACNGDVLPFRPRAASPLAVAA